MQCLLWYAVCSLVQLLKGPSSSELPSGCCRLYHQLSSNTTANSSSISKSSSVASAASVSTAGADGTSQSNPGYELVYNGYFARPHRRLKYASLLNTFASFAAAPLIISYSAASPIARVAVTTAVIAFAAITTGGLHWFTKPYVHQMLVNRTSDVAKVQMLSFFGRTVWREFPLSSVTAPTGYHPLASFKAQGRTYYIDRGNFLDAELLKRLVPSSDSPAGQGHEEAAQHSDQAATRQH
eukprot:GHRR01021652.1.p1 GENE.GHRR01021652.1~~GHRR01021652.1.p1  ORF type:complete len:239 (+),score=76.79 GHRR01021652.1:924-1640(+)